MARTCWFAAFFLGICLARPAVADEPALIHPERHQRVQQTIEHAISYLQTEGAGWLKTRRCAACHHVSMTLWALSEADRDGYAIDKEFLTHTTEVALGSREKMIASGLLPDPARPPDPRPMARGVNMGIVFMAVSAWSVSSLDEGERRSLGLITDDIVSKQRNDGSWEFFLSRPPINESQTTDAAWMILALTGEPERDAPESHREALAKAIAWLAHSELPETHQDKALKTLVAIRVGKSRDELQAAIGQLLALQRPDGGWSQLAGMKSDAFATGQMLYVLAVAGYAADRREIRRAIDFLVSSQKPDGSWPMTSRATPDGRPGSAKLLTPITTGAAAWATLGLARSTPNRP